VINIRFQIKTDYILFFSKSTYLRTGRFFIFARREPKCYWAYIAVTYDWLTRLVPADILGKHVRTHVSDRSRTWRNATNKLYYTRWSCADYVYSLSLLWAQCSSNDRQRFNEKRRTRLTHVVYTQFKKTFRWEGDRFCPVGIDTVASVPRLHKPSDHTNENASNINTTKRAKKSNVVRLPRRLPFAARTDDNRRRHLACVRPSLVFSSESWKNSSNCYCGYELAHRETFGV